MLKNGGVTFYRDKGREMAKGRKRDKDQKPGQEPPAPNGRWVKYWPALMVMVVPFFLYAESLKAGFVWDDHNLIEQRVERPSLRELGRLWISDFWQIGQKSSSSQYYRPLTTSTFLLDRLVHKNNPRGYHLTNIIIYSIACGLAFFLYQKFFRSTALALVMALAFAAHPAHTENAAWLSGRTDIVCGAMMFGALLAYLRAEETGKPWQMAVSVALFLLSLFGKEMSIAMVAVVFVHQWLGHGHLRRAVLRSLPFVLAALVFWIIHAMAAPHLAEENIYLTPWTYTLNAARNLSLGVWYSLVPGGFHYLVAATREEAATAFALPEGIKIPLVLFPLFAAAAGAGVAAWKKERVIALALCSGLLFLAPISGIIPIGVIFAIRLLFIPSFFFLLALGGILERAAARSFSLGGFTVSGAAALMAPVIAVYAVMTAIQVPAWRNDVTLMEAVIAREPDAALAHFIMGNGLALQDREEEAISHFKRAIALRPEYPEAQCNLGIMEQRRGRLPEAEKWYWAALKVKPDYLPARMALVRLLQATGRQQEALALIPNQGKDSPER